MPYPRVTVASISPLGDVGVRLQHCAPISQSVCCGASERTSANRPTSMAALQGGWWYRGEWTARRDGGRTVLVYSVTVDAPARRIDTELGGEAGIPA